MNRTDAIGQVLAFLMPRRKYVDYTYPTGWKPKDIVVVTAPDIFKGAVIGVVVDPIKWCKEGVTVYVPDSANPRYLCIVEDRGHTIVKATK